MQSWWDKKVEDLSKGMQQKVQFVATVLHEPALIILDEPFSGFDPVNAQIIQEEILQLNKNGATIIFSTHRMETVEELCDRVALIHKSKKVLDGSVYDIKKQYRSQSYKLVLESSEQEVEHAPAALYTELKRYQKNNSTYLEIKLAEHQSLNQVLMYLIPKVHIQSVEELVPSMHDIFIQTVRQHTQTN